MFYDRFDRYPSDITEPCECCLSAHAVEWGLCRECLRSEEHVTRAEYHDAASIVAEDERHTPRISPDEVRRMGCEVAR